MPLKLLVLWSSTVAERERMPLPAHQIGDTDLAKSTTSVRLAKTADERRTRRDRPSPGMSPTEDKMQLQPPPVKGFITRFCRIRLLTRFLAGVIITACLQQEQGSRRLRPPVASKPVQVAMTAADTTTARRVPGAGLLTSVFVTLVWPVWAITLAAWAIQLGGLSAVQYSTGKHYLQVCYAFF